MFETEYMIKRELAETFDVGASTISARFKNGTVIDGHRVGRRRVVEDDDVHALTQFMWRGEPVKPTPKARKPSKAARMRQRRQDADHEADARWHSARREEAEAEVEALTVRLRELEQRIADAEAALVDALQERNVANERVEQLMDDEPPHVKTLVDAVWTALGENTLEQTRDVLLLSVREFVEARR